MKVKTSISLSEDLLIAIDARVGDFRNRSDLIDTAVRAFLKRLEREEQNAKDLAAINRHADALNSEAEDVLTYQALV